MKQVVCFALCMSIPGLALAQTDAQPGTQPGYAYPPPQGYGYPPPQQGGYPPPQQGYGYPPPQQGYGYPPPQQGGYPPPQGYDYPPPQQGYGYPPPPAGGVNAPAAAPTKNLTGLTLVAGLGFGQPFGDYGKSSSSSSDTSMGSLTSGQFPFSIGAGYRPIPLLSFGLTGQFAPLTSKNCPSSESCSFSDSRIGGEVRFHIIPDQMFSPWVSAGIGYEWLTLTESEGSLSADTTFTGWDFEFQVGGDIRVTPFMTIGPYVGLRLGTFGHASFSGDVSTPVDADIPDANQAMHGWWTLGARASFTLFPTSN
jgi:hypothetical protein